MNLLNFFPQEFSLTSRLEVASILFFATNPLEEDLSRKEEGSCNNGKLD